MKLLTAMVALVAVGVLVSAVGVGSGARQQTVTCGDEIDQRGNYVLAGDCTATLNGIVANGIVVNADDVVLDLDGHTITGGNTLGDGVLINGDNVHLKGPGTIGRESAGFANGVLVRRSNAHVTQVTTTNDDVGIRVSGIDNRIVNNTSRRNFKWDLLDQNTDCDRSTWASNVFGTANRPCIK